MSAAAVAFPAPRLLLFGLDEALSTELLHSLTDYEAHTQPHLPEDVESGARLLAESRAHVVFIPAEAGRMKRSLDAAKAAHLPAIVVSHSADIGQWLDAMDAGASDYAAAPFDVGELRWILRSTLR